MLVPEQAAIGPLQHLAAPQGHDYMTKNYELECDECGCISGDTNSSDSIDQSRKRQQWFTVVVASYINTVVIEIKLA